MKSKWQGYRERWTDQALSLARFVGRPAITVLSFGLIGSILLSIAEFGVALFIQFFLVALGIMNQPATGPLSSINISLPLAGLILVGVAATRFLGQFLVILASGRSMALMQQRLRTALCAGMLYNDSPPNMSETQAHLSETFPKASHLAHSVSTCFASSIQMIALLVAMSVAAWREAAVALVFLAIVGLLVIKVNRVVRSVADNLPNQQLAISSNIERIASNWILVTILKTRGQEFSRTKREIDSQTETASRAYTLGAWAGALPPFLGILILLGVIFLSQGAFSTAPSSLLIFLYLFVRFVQNMAGAAVSFGLISSHFGYFKSAFSHFKKVEQHFRMALNYRRPSDESNASSESARPKTIITFSEGDNHDPLPISIENMTFKFPSSTQPLIQGLDLQIEAGQHFGIVGPSGSGKSTLLLLMLGILKPSSGSILIGREAAMSAIANPALRIAYVGPEPFLFEGTIKDNLLYGYQESEKPSEAEILHILKQIGLNPSNEPSYLQTMLVAGGQNFSTGQRQRLCIARAFLAKPQLLILDEATANLDRENEARVQLIIQSLKGKCTLVLVTHRQESISNLDDNISSLEAFRSGSQSKDSLPT